MKSEPLISILTVTFNHRKYIQDTIESVLRQTYKNWEWIIIDDGSTDGTGDFVKKLKDKRIKYVYQNNAGMLHFAGNYNKALRLSKGNLIAMLDGDDYWPDYKLQVQAEKFADPAIVFCYGECCIVDESGKRIGYIQLPVDPAVANNNPIGTALSLFLKITHIRNYLAIHDSTIMVKKDALLSIEGFEESRASHQDWPTWTKLSLEGRFAAVPACLGYWRRHPSAITYQHNPIIWFDAGIDFLRDFILKNKQKLYSLGFFYNLGDLEKHWQNTRRDFIYYLPFNTAMRMLKLGLFRQAKDEFKKFLEKEPSFKNLLGYALFALSSLTNYDIVHPLLSLKERVGKTLRLHYRAS